MDKHNLSFEPMDIDQSAHSSNDMDISFNESIHEVDDYLRNIKDDVRSPTPARTEVDTTSTSSSIPPYTAIIKKFHINMQRETVSTFNTTKVKVVSAALVWLLSIVAYQVLNIQCSGGINIVELRKSLSYKLYGQTKAIDSLIQGLGANERSKILILYGSTGVGKTFAASTLLEHVGSYSNIYHYTMPSFMETFNSDFMVGLTVCKNSIMIVDDLSINDVDVEVHIKNLITKSDSLEKGVTVLLIYNCNPTKDYKRHCDMTFPTKVMEIFKQIKAYKKLIRFETLNEKHLRKCIETELGHRKISENEFTKILKNFDVNIDGCKGVHTKIKLLDIS